MTKDQCAAIIKAISKTAEYLAIVNLFDDKTIAGAATSQALDPLNEKFDGEIDDIIEDIPADETPADNTPDDNQEET